MDVKWDNPIGLIVGFKIFSLAPCPVRSARLDFRATKREYDHAASLPSQFG